jgi:hypothetical protein
MQMAISVVGEIESPRPNVVDLRAEGTRANERSLVQCS